jgi:transcriptional regulator with GAF, ATPase, and Fis domain
LDILPKLTSLGPKGPSRHTLTLGFFYSDSFFSINTKADPLKLRRFSPKRACACAKKTNIELVLQHTDWKVYGTGGAAELLGLKPTTLLSRIQKDGDCEIHLSQK